MGMRMARRQQRRPEGPGADTLQVAGNGTLRLVAVFGLALLMTAIVGLGAYQLVYGARIMLGVRVYDVDVGGLGRADATRLVTSKLSEYQNKPIVLRQDKQEYKLAPSQMGAQFDVGKTVDNALLAGKQGNPLNKILTQFAALGTGVNVQASFSIDPDKYAAAVKQLSVFIDKTTVNANVKIEGGQVQLAPPTEGLAVDQAKLRDLLEGQIRVLSSAPIEIPVIRTPPKVTLQDLEPAKTQAERLISAPVTLTLDGKPLDDWTIGIPRLTSSVVFEQTDNNGKTQWTAKLKPEVLQDIGNRLAAEINQKPQNARFDWNGGNLKPIAAYPGRDGRALDVDQFVKDVLKAAEGSDRKVALPVKVDKPAVGPNDAAKMGIKGLIEERKTNYEGGAAERRQNVELGASRLHGAVVAPGATFSFANEVGEVSEATGYELGYAIVGGNTVPDFGGGICQVSTTLFQSVFWAGYEIVDQTSHEYRIRRYEQPAGFVGLDATVYPPILDFKFKNDSDSYILIQARTDGKWIYVRLYGTKPNWTVTVEPPKISNIVPAPREIIRQYTPKLAKGREVWVEAAEDGLDVTVTRTVRQGNEVRTKTIPSHYRPERNVVLIGTGGEPAPPDEVIQPAAPTPTEGPEETATPAATFTPTAVPQSVSVPTSAPPQPSPTQPKR